MRDQSSIRILMWAQSAACTAAVVISSVLPNTSPPLGLPDKSLHLAAGAVLAVSFTLSWATTATLRVSSLVWIAVWVVGLAMVLELVQGSVAGRSSEAADVVATALGAAGALAAANLVRGRSSAGTGRGYGIPG